MSDGPASGRGYALVDLRSDTVTTPTDAMWRAMSRCDVGDDVYGEDPTVRRLEETAAEMLGKDQALFVPSGTMGNLIALLVHTIPGSRVLIPEQSHVEFMECGSGASVAGVQLDPVPSEGGLPGTGAVRSALAQLDYQMPHVALAVLENTHNFLGGRVLPPDGVAALAAEFRRTGTPLHLDGARLFNAAASLARTVAELAGPADTVMICLSKGLAAPVGSLLCGPTDLMDRARRARKMLGGGMRQAGILAAAGMVALETMPARLGADHELARALAQGLTAMSNDTIAPNTVDTNIVMADPQPLGLAAPDLVAGLAERGVRALPVPSNGYVRFVTHKDICEADVGRVLAAVEEVADQRPQ